MKQFVYIVTYKSTALQALVDPEFTVYPTRKLAREAKRKYVAKGLKDYKIYKVTTEIVR